MKLKIFYLQRILQRTSTAKGQRKKVKIVTIRSLAAHLLESLNIYRSNVILYNLNNIANTINLAIRVRYQTGTVPYPEYKVYGLTITKMVSRFGLIPTNRWAGTH